MFCRETALELATALDQLSAGLAGTGALRKTELEGSLGIPLT